MSGNRSRAGCLTCRARKVHCDKSGETCKNCERLDLQCRPSNKSSLSSVTRSELIQSATARQDVNQAGLRRIRANVSCQFCRSRKQKCSGEQPSCARCLKDNRVCLYQRAKDAIRITPAVMGPSIPDNPVDRSFIQSLVETFFQEVAPLRCFGFIHKPSYIQQMNILIDAEREDPLLYAICALATKTIDRRAVWDVGSQWASKTQRMIFDAIEDISVHMLMCIVLLHEHSVRIGRLKLSVILSSLAARYCQALQLNVEAEYGNPPHTPILSATEKETHRRLMWSCYLMDSIGACGLDQLKVLHEKDIKIQLPCDEDTFLFTTPQSPRFLPVYGMQQPSPDDSARSDPPKGPKDFRALYVELAVMRDRILRYHVSFEQDEYPWGPTPDFNLLLADLQTWKASVPHKWSLSPDVTYIRTEQFLLSALISLHILHHQCYFDLYRVMTPIMIFPPKDHNAMSLTVSADFLEEGRKRWFENACEVTDIFRISLERAPYSMTEPETAITAYTAIRVKLFYLMRILSEEERSRKMNAVNELIQSDLEYLRLLSHLHPSASRICCAAEDVVSSMDPGRTGVFESSRNAYSPETWPDANLPVRMSQVSADYMLHPLAIFRIIGNDLPEKHIPERTLPRQVNYDYDYLLAGGQC